MVISPFLIFAAGIILMAAVLPDDERKRLLAQVRRYGPRMIGKQEYIRFLSGQYLTRQEAINAECFVCMGYYADGKGDCENPACPLYRRMPYRNKGKSGEKTPLKNDTEGDDDV